MIKINKYFLIFFSLILLFFVNTNNQFANEIMIYADNISYDSEGNLLASGNAKIIYDNNLITSELIIYSKKNEEVVLPLKFNLKDERNNFIQGSNGLFSKDLKYGSFEDIKVLLSDGSRIVGSKAKRENNSDIISKAVYTPCDSKIKIANFLCPIWQLEGEKMLHDYDNLFLYQKHSKMRFLNVPIFYSPYLVTPSPLRKERKSGFLTPSINLNFFDTKISQATSLPYYFNLNVDKELTFTPTINYGGGVDSSQRFSFDYNQKLSGGKLNTKLSFDTTLENKNNQKWFKDGSLINNYNINLNEKFNLSLESTLQTSKNYIQQTNPNDDLSYLSSLSSSLDVKGYNIKKNDDFFRFNLKTYQSNQNNEDNKTIPTILPFISYFTGEKYFKNLKYDNNFEFYNIFRDSATEVHSKSQRKLSSKITASKDFVKWNSFIKFESEIHNQLFDVENKKIDNNYVNSSYFRSFPIIGLALEKPFRIKNKIQNDIKYTPKLSFIITPGMSNTNKISNEDSSVNSFLIENNISLNRFTGTDKLDNSKRLNLGFNIEGNNLNLDILQTYEFTENSNFHYSQGNENKLSDLLGQINYKNDNYSTQYNFRYDHNDEFIKSQNLEYKLDSRIGNFKLNYLDQKSKTDEIITQDSETMNYRFESVKIKRYSKLSYFGLYDLISQTNKESGISYSYFDECFGVNVDFKRNSYIEEELKPQDILTIMFSFKNVGSYKSTNLAVSENDKQDIEWEDQKINNELFD